MEKRITRNKPIGITEEEKIRSWNIIEQHLVAAPSPFSYTALRKRTQSKIVAGILTALVLSGGVATAYASNAKPGDLLFPIAIAKEKAQIIMTKDGQKKEALRVEFAQKRLKEVRELAALIDTDPAYATSSETVFDTTPALSKEETKRAERAKHGTAVALRELEATRDTLRRDGRGNATTVIDDIISEMQAVSLETREERKQRERKEGQDAREADPSRRTPRDQFQETKKSERDNAQTEKSDGRTVSTTDIKSNNETEVTEIPLIIEPNSNNRSRSETVSPDKSDDEAPGQDPRVPSIKGETRDDR
ncbi:MAG: hypothetical protein A2845_04790 [Candidatus Lloydbacteria bacterium RIFCSPHIGHO2_01_FULL_49_22]|uniref:Uncharacterized protein n=1 Tax=Candidatus Lloydbacteria bacterium RIFCSPHIGHO2_01_FULL_49_22 TaxID=1798658 RepID=A0A1G2CWB8_9BACT|nr:MAG: hypothetical protein A2845_04790 [Candidatus Lloydbacteria bacterium RIFCSPHIGHO2_01_FULL_49_22]OGZ10128.1 MAG: hypothetical protein A3C14_00825 [Candidatus Lloydbacteria bacterium RIFCSPHIGHO2_02_FULL_50_18]